jgi:hypothetical protein
VAWARGEAHGVDAFGMNPVEELEIQSLESELPMTSDLGVYEYTVPIVDPADRRFWPNIRGSSFWWTNERLLSPMNRGRLGSPIYTVCRENLVLGLIYTSASRCWRCRQCFQSYFAAGHVVPGNDTPHDQLWIQDVGA